MSAVPLSDTVAKRRIGDILLSLGFVDAEQLAKATAEQERTQQPLGQILVGHGAITRLELASALAEQWSDPAASIAISPRPAPGPAPVPSPRDEAQYAARLQEAVADLTRRVQSNQPLEGIDERVEELSRRIESTLARTQHIEAALATLAESLEGVTGGVEEAFAAQQTGTADLASDISRIESMLHEVAAKEQPHVDGSSLAELEELRAAIADLRGEIEGADAADRVNALAARLDGLADPLQTVEGLGERLEGVVARIEAVEGATGVDELRASVLDLERRAAGIVGLEERLDRVEAGPGGEQLHAALQSHEQELEALRGVLATVHDRPESAPELEERLLQIEERLRASAGSQADLVTLVDDLGGRIAERTDSDASGDDVVERVGSLESRIDTILADVEGSAAGISAQEVAAVDARVADLARALDELRGEMARLSDGFVTPAQLAETVERLTGATAPDEELVTKLEALEARLSDGVVTPAQLAETREGLTGATAPDEELAARLEALEARLSDGVVTPDTLTQSLEWAMGERPVPVADEQVAELSAEIAALRLDVASLTRPPEPSSGSEERLAEIEARIEGLVMGRSEDTELAIRLGELEESRRADLDTVRALAQAVEASRQEARASPRVADGEIAAITTALTELARRTAALEESQVPERETGLAVPELISEVESVRLVLERVSLHLGEHDRALAELSSTRGVHERLEELTAVVRSLDQPRPAEARSSRSKDAPPVSGDVGALLQRVEEAEAAAKQSNEKLMNRLERMASSIDWRLQRLESPPADDAA